MGEVQKEQNASASLNNNELNGFHGITFPTDSKVEKKELPVVFILGWMASTDKHLSKYSQIYENIECITIKFCYMTAYHELASKTEHKNIKKSTKMLLKILRKNHLMSNPIFIHFFSNSGAQIYCGLGKKLMEEKCNIIGTVFDSSPIKMTYSNLLSSLYYATRTNICFYILVAIATTFIFLWKIITHVLGISKIVQPFNEIVTWDFAKWPHMFLYATSDKVCPAEDVLEFKQIMKRNGSILTRHHDFETSPHVLHLRHHQEKYVQHCVEFFKDCLAIYRGQDMNHILAKSEKLKKECSIAQSINSRCKH